MDEFNIDLYSNHSEAQKSSNALHELLEGYTKIVELALDSRLCKAVGIQR